MINLRGRKVDLSMTNDILITKIHRVIYIGNEEYPESQTIFTNTLTCHELILHLSGDMTIYFDDKVLHCNTNTVRFLPKGTCKEYRVIRHENGECIDVFFDSAAPLSEEAFVQKIANNIQIRHLFKKLFSVWVGKGDGYYLESLSLLYKIFVEIQKENYIPQKQYLIIKPALEYIDEHFFKDKISINLLAELCGISTSYLKKLFIKRFGVTPSRYIIQRKINYACDLLKYERYSIAQTAFMSGYDNLYYFSRQFKEYVGISPTTYIQKYKSSK